jgi:hypothetical protein
MELGTWASGSWSVVCDFTLCNLSTAFELFLYVATVGLLGGTGRGPVRRWILDVIELP